jgi:hypothetical protein
MQEAFLDESFSALHADPGQMLMNFAGQVNFRGATAEIIWMNKAEAVEYFSAVHCCLSRW